MSKNFYISDTHFGHKNILRYDNRPFFTTTEMDKEMIARWNSAVQPDDTVYILGDFCWKGEDRWFDILEHLNGRKVLIRGNHDPDKMSDRVAKHFAEVVDYKEVDDAGRKIVLCHYPIPCFKNHFYGWYHLYGHVHVSFEANMMESDKYLMRDLYDKQCNMYNVGCMMPWMDYTPRTLDEIIERYSAGGNPDGKV